MIFSLNVFVWLYTGVHCTHVHCTHVHCTMYWMQNRFTEAWASSWRQYLRFGRELGGASTCLSQEVLKLRHQARQKAMTKKIHKNPCGSWLQMTERLRHNFFHKKKVRTRGRDGTWSSRTRGLCFASRRWTYSTSCSCCCSVTYSYRPWFL